MHDPGATVVAVGTPPGRGGVGCLRVTGDAAEAIALRLFRPARSETVDSGRSLRFGKFVDRCGRPIDHGYLVVFEPSRSFTGETAAELWTHGSPAVLAALLDAAVQAGARPAEAGEFTYRALRNGRLDLSRAEAVRDLIASRTAYQARVAFAQAEGALARRLEPLRDALEECIARGEAAVEFVDEGETQLPGDALRRAVAEVKDGLSALLAEFRIGRLVSSGAVVAIVGLPNAGKSSVFNRLVGHDRAIVADAPGTTRDTVETTIDLGGIPVRLVDTAGLRDADDAVESEGVRRASAARAEAELVLLLVDDSRSAGEAETRALLQTPRRETDRTLIVRNKADLPRLQTTLPEDIAVSARTGEGIERLREELRLRLVGRTDAEDPVLTNARHALALESAAAALARSEQALLGGLSEEFALHDLLEARRHVGDITGEFATEDMLARIFSTFCIGK